MALSLLTVVVSYSPFQATLDEHTTIVKFYITNEHLITFIVTRQTQKPIVWQSEIQNLEIWANAYLENLEDYSAQKNEWQEQLTYQLEHISLVLSKLYAIFIYNFNIKTV